MLNVALAYVPWGKAGMATGCTTPMRWRISIGIGPDATVTLPPRVSLSDSEPVVMVKVMIQSAGFGADVGVALLVAGWGALPKFTWTLVLPGEGVGDAAAAGPDEGGIIPPPLPPHPKAKIIARNKGAGLKQKEVKTLGEAWGADDEADCMGCSRSAQHTSRNSGLVLNHGGSYKHCDECHRGKR